jgi:hypothetical protein
MRRILIECSTGHWWRELLAGWSRSAKWMMKFRIQQPQWRLLNIHNDLCFWPSLFPAITVHEMSAGGRILPSKQIRSLEKSKILRISKQVLKSTIKSYWICLKMTRMLLFAVKSQFADLVYFLAHNKSSKTIILLMISCELWWINFDHCLCHFMNHMGIQMVDVRNLYQNRC